MKFNVDVKGLDDVIRKLEKQLGKEAEGDINKITEAYARKMASEASEMAPIKDSYLKNSLAGSAEPSDTEPNVWEWGSDLEYAIIQEYTHKTHKGFVRKAIWNNREKYRNAVLKRISRG